MINDDEQILQTFSALFLHLISTSSDFNPSDAYISFVIFVGISL